MADEEQDLGIRLDGEIAAESSIPCSAEPRYLYGRGDDRDPVRRNAVHPDEIVADLLRDCRDTQIAT